MVNIVVPALSMVMLAQGSAFHVEPVSNDGVKMLIEKSTARMGKPPTVVGIGTFEAVKETIGCDLSIRDLIKIQVFTGAQVLLVSEDKGGIHFSLATVRKL